MKYRPQSLYLLWICIWLFAFAECRVKSTDYALDVKIVKHLKDSIDIPKVIGSEFTIIKSRIKGGKLLVTAVGGKQDSYFIVIDLSTKQIEYTMKDPFNDYVSSLFDMDSTNIYVMSALKPDTMFVASMHRKGTESVFLGFEKAISPGEIAVNRKQLFMYRDVYGVAVINLQDYSKKVFHNNGIHVVNPKSSTISIPLDKTLNLISGHLVDTQSFRLYAVDFADSVRWVYHFREGENVGSEVSILNYPQSFIVKYDSTVLSLDKAVGKPGWQRVLDGSISEVYKWHDEILVYSLKNARGTFPDSDSVDYKTSLWMFSCRDGREIWHIKMNSIGTPHIGICGNSLITTDNNSMAVFSMENGNLLDRSLFFSREKGKFAFEMLEDITTGGYYLRTFDEKIYW